jgi:hypothetical protein
MIVETYGRNVRMVEEILSDGSAVWNVGIWWDDGDGVQTLDLACTTRERAEQLMTAILSLAMDAKEDFPVRRVQ